MWVREGWRFERFTVAAWRWIDEREKTSINSSSLTFNIKTHFRLFPFLSPFFSMMIASPFFTFLAFRVFERDEVYSRSYKLYFIRQKEGEVPIARTDEYVVWVLSENFKTFHKRAINLQEQSGNFNVNFSLHFYSLQRQLMAVSAVLMDLFHHCGLSWECFHHRNHRSHRLS